MPKKTTLVNPGQKTNTGGIVQKYEKLA